MEKIISEWLAECKVEVKFQTDRTHRVSSVRPDIPRHARNALHLRSDKPLMRGKCRLIRFADDFVIIFEKKNDADRVMAVISKRWLPPAQKFEKYGLTVHPEKTKALFGQSTDIDRLQGAA